MQITTNNQPRDLLGFWELSQEDQQDAREAYSYLESNEDLESYFGFFIYKNQLHCLDEYLRTPIEGWDAACSDSFFSGTVIRLCEDDCDRVIVGTYMS